MCNELHTMPPISIDDLKECYAFKTWRTANTLVESLFIWKFFLNGEEFPDWHACSIEPIEREHRPPYILSTWDRSDHEASERLNVTIFETPSRIEAHEHMVHVLFDFQPSLVGRRDVFDIGDVAFGRQEDPFVVYARANLVLRLRHAGRGMVPISDIARRFDKALTRRPDTTAVAHAPVFKTVEPLNDNIQVGVDMPLTVEAYDPLDLPVWYKFYAYSGEVYARNDQVVYRPAVSGPQSIMVYAINASGGAASQKLHLDVA